MTYDLTNLDRSVAIFEIDDDTFRGHARFARHLDEKCAMYAIRQPVEQGMGHWEGVNSTCYVMDASEFMAYVHETPYVEEQDAFMFANPKARGVIQFNAPQTNPIRGIIKKVDTSETAAYDGFTLLKRGAYVLTFDA